MYKRYYFRKVRNTGMTTLMRIKANKKSDADLITAIRAGGAERELAWKYIYYEWRGYYLKPVLSAGGKPEQADEVLGLVFRNVEKEILKPDFELREATFATYLTKVVYREWVRFKQKEGRYQQMVAPEEQATPVLSDEDIGHQLMLREKLKKVEAMGDPCRTILLMKGEGYSNEDIAAVLHFSVQHIKNTAVDCRKKLINLLGGKNYY